MGTGAFSLSGSALTVTSPVAIASGQTMQGGTLNAPVNMALGGTIGGTAAIGGNVTATGGTIAGTPTLGGALTVNGGTGSGPLSVNANIAPTTVSVANGGTLGGAGAISQAISVSTGGTLTGTLTTGVVTSVGGVIAPNAGTLKVGGLSLDNATSLAYTLGSTSGSINASGGSVNLSNAILDITAGANFTTGSYTLINNASSLGGTLTLLAANLPLDNTFFTYGQTEASGTVTLNVTRMAHTYQWTGAGSDTNWTDANNWNGPSGYGLYPVNGDTANLNFTATNPTNVNVDQAASVTAMGFTSGSWNIGGQGIAIGSGGLNYQSTGTSVISSPITGTTLNVSAGSLKLQNAQTFSGPVTVGASSGTATLLVDASAALYTPAVVINAGGVLSGNGTIDAPVNLAGGQLTSGSDTLMLDGGNLTSTGGTIAGTVQFGPTQAWVLTHSSGTLTISGSISDQNSVTTGLPAAACFDIGGGTVTGNGLISYQSPGSLDGVNVHDGATVTGDLTITTNYLYICNASVSLTGGTVNIDSGQLAVGMASDWMTFNGGTYGGSSTINLTNNSSLVIYAGATLSGQQMIKGDAGSYVQIYAGGTLTGNNTINAAVKLAGGTIAGQQAINGELISTGGTLSSAHPDFRSAAA